jgi:very-short-patch-repair endonuclease
MKRRYRKKDNPFVTGFLLFVLLTSIYISINYVPKQFLTLERFPVLFFVVFATTTLIAGITLIVTLKIWRKYTSKKKQEKESKPHKNEKKFLSPAEKEFKKYLRQNLPENIEIHCKVRLADILKTETTYRRIMMMHVDYALLDADTQEIVLVIELDDTSHETEKAKERDAIKNNALKESRIKFTRIPDSKKYHPIIINEIVEFCRNKTGKHHVPVSHHAK